jgi:hypothetical protein
VEFLRKNAAAWHLFLWGMAGLFLCVSSCSGPGAREALPENKPDRGKPAIIKKPASSYNDTLRISGLCAVFYSPDSVQMNKIRAVNKVAVFAMLTHDCHYQMEYSRVVLEKYWPKIRIIETSRARYLVFEKMDKSKICVDLNDKNDICGVFLFDGKKEPVLADMPNIDTVLGFYFNHQ